MVEFDKDLAECKLELEMLPVGDGAESAVILAGTLAPAPSASTAHCDSPLHSGDQRLQKRCFVLFFPPGRTLQEQIRNLKKQLVLNMRVAFPPVHGTPGTARWDRS